MSWMISVCIVLVLTSLSGTIAFLVWKLWAAYMEQRKKLRWIYPMLAVVEFFFAIPFVCGVVILWQILRDGAGAENSYVLMRNDTISILCTMAFTVWISVALVYLVSLAKKVRQVRRALRDSCVPAEKEMTALANKIHKRLGIHQRVLVCQSGLTKVPVVVNGLRKRVIFPIRKYEDHATEVILCHELTHVKQGVLTLKMIGSLLRIVYWFNPFIHAYMRELDEWGETACDIAVRYNGGCVADFREYFRIVMDTVEQRMDASNACTQLVKTKGIEARVMRVRDYKRDNDWGLAGGVAAMLIFCLTCTAMVTATGIGLGNGYNAICENTVEHTEL